MREIKFRGKMVGKNGINDWVFGYIQPIFPGMCIMQICKYKTSSGIELFTIDENTVGQYTGVKDKNGKEIYEGDVLKLIFKDKYSDLEMEGVVKFCQDHLSFNCFDGTYPWGSPLGKWNISQMEIIGNVFDNPEYKERFGRVFEDET